ncbi:MAG: sigma-70 family RNA polymerase sigma factor [Treponema sp.]|uniref:sigma-70 family RNA polymerase sigma factor n=1 Tax=Treponema sp. TaxID=166 RepID=UPI002A90C31A|nr:sigma-70 family RNA polymerase sigma factor [Treponema sp.]MDY6397083.1 sigma-70 family RNA polymerase sigma factor [Treponema sp.]
MKMYEMYLNQIQRFPLLDAESERELAVKISAGDKKAVTRLVNSNLRLVVSIANKFKKTYKVSVMDLIQEGNLGLMAAAEKFSPEYETRFSTYAYPWILQYMLRFLHNKTSIISIPQRKEEVLRRLSTIQSEYSEATGKKASKKELALSLGITEDELNSALECLYTCTSLDSECMEDGSMTVGELIPDFTYDPERNFFIEIAKSNIKQLVAELSEKERVVISGRYNFDGLANAPTLREIGLSLGVSAETIRQTELKALKKIRQALNGKTLELYTA